jgi:hypothetical protein
MSASTILNAVKQRFQAEEATAVATLELYVNNSVGVGEHPNIVEEVEKQVRALSEARECLKLLHTLTQKDTTQEEST